MAKPTQAYKWMAPLLANVKHQVDDGHGDDLLNLIV